MRIMLSLLSTRGNPLLTTPTPDMTAIKGMWDEIYPVVNAVVATVLGSIPVSSDTVESEGRQMKQC